MAAHGSGWRRHFFYRTESVRTTWKLRIAILVGLGLLALVTRAVWVPALGRSLMCAEDVRVSDAILVENFDPEYLLFKRAAALQRGGLAPRVLIPVESSPEDPAVPDAVARGIADVMVRLAGLRNVEVIPTRHAEPVSFNAANQIRDFLTTRHLRSITVVAPAFRSRRSSLVYDRVLAPAGIRVSCVPVLDDQAPDTWARTWHGIQEVTLQFVKLQAYRFYVLPRSDSTRNP